MSEERVQQRLTTPVDRAPVGPPPHQKGQPCLWNTIRSNSTRHMTKAPYAPNLSQVVKRYAINSEKVRTLLGEPKRFAYGTTPIGVFEVYQTKHANAPIHIHIHGGEWRMGLARDNAYPAEPFVAAGAHFVVIDFVNVLEANGSLMPMANQVGRAIAWVYRNAQEFGGDKNQIYVSGHSSGAHLTGVMLVSDWGKNFDLPVDVVKGGLCCGGMFDLTAVRLSARRKYIEFTDEVVHALSPQRHLDKLNCPLICFVRHAGDAGIPAAIARFRGCGESSRQARYADRRRRLQSFRADRDLG